MLAHLVPSQIAFRVAQNVIMKGPSGRLRFPLEWHRGCRSFQDLFSIIPVVGDAVSQRRLPIRNARHTIRIRSWAKGDSIHKTSSKRCERTAIEISRSLSRKRIQARPLSNPAGKSLDSRRIVRTSVAKMLNDDAVENVKVARRTPSDVTQRTARGRHTHHLLTTRRKQHR